MYVTVHTDDTFQLVLRAVFSHFPALIHSNSQSQSPRWQFISIQDTNFGLNVYDNGLQVTCRFPTLNAIYSPMANEAAPRTQDLRHHSRACCTVKRETLVSFC